MYRIRKFARRNKVAFATTSIVAISLVLGLIGTTGQAIRASRAEEAAANSAAEAEAFNDFLVEDLLGLAGAESQLSAGLQPDPNLKLETLLNRASEKVDQSFADRPELKAKLKGTLAKSFRSIGQYDVAIEICEELLAYSIANKGKKHSDTIRIMRQLARVYIDQSQLADAESLCQEALEYSREVLGPEDPETLLLMNVLAILYYEQERYAASERVHRECLEIRRRQLGERNPDTLATMSNLALVYESLGRFEAAGELHTQVLERHRQIFDARHPRVAASLHNLGRYYLQRGRLTDNPTLFETAESPLFEALGIYRQVRGENHPDSLGVQRDLVDVFCEQHRYGEAESMLLDFVDRVRSVLGSEHDVTLQALNTLGWIYLRQERYAEAEYILDDVLTTRRAKSLEDLATIQTMGNLAIVYRVMGKRRDSILLDEELRELADEVLGSEHPQTLSSMVRLGLSYLDDGQRREGKNLLEEAFESGQELSGVFNIAGVVATSYAEEGDSQQALTWTNHQVESAGRELPGDGLRMAQVLGDGGQRLLKIEAWTDAERLLSRSLSIRESLEPDAWATHETRSKLGVALAGQARYGDAESLLKESYAELLKQVSDHPDGSHGKLIIVLDRLIAFYDDVENEPEAAKLRKERAEIEAASIAR